MIRYVLFSGGTRLADSQEIVGDIWHLAASRPDLTYPHRTDDRACFAADTLVMVAHRPPDCNIILSFLKATQ